MNNSNWLSQMQIGKSIFADPGPKHVCLRSKPPANISHCIYLKNIKLILQSIPGLPNSTAEFVREKLFATMKIKNSCFKRVERSANVL